MTKKDNAKQNKGGAFLLMLVGFYFLTRFVDLVTTDKIIGMIVSVGVILLWLYSFFKTKSI